MYNYFMLLGRTMGEPVLEEFDNGRKKAVIKLKVTRPFSNDKGEFEEDVLDITFWDYLINFIQENLIIGVPVMVKGRIQTNKKGIELIGERIILFNKSKEVVE